MPSLPSLKGYLSAFETVMSHVIGAVAMSVTFLLYHLLVALGADLPGLLNAIIPNAVPPPFAGILVSALGYVLGHVISALIYLLKGSVPVVPESKS